MYPELFKSIIGTVVRRLLFGVTTWLTAQGWLTGEQLAELWPWIILGVASVVWSIWGKIRAWLKLDTALRLPAHASYEALNEEFSKK